MPDQPQPPIASVIGLPPDDTVRAFEARDTLRLTTRWSEMMHEDHARAFTVAKVAKLDLLQTIRDSLHDVVSKGGTFEQWQKAIVPQLQQAGWWGDVADKSLTGTDDVVHVGPRRLRTIYDTNLRMSRAAGRWSRIQALKGVRPFLRYTAVMDARTRPQHRLWHGTILPVDHEWWDTHFPPCGWFCRCIVRQLSQRELDAKGWRVAKEPPVDRKQLFYPASGGAPIAVPSGIAPGFGYNPGKASLAPIADRAGRSIEQTAQSDLSAARGVLDELVASDALPTTLAEPDASFPVMVLDLATKAQLGIQSSVPMLPSTVATTAQAGGVGLPELRTLPTVGAAPDHVGVAEGARWIVKRDGDSAIGARLTEEPAPDVAALTDAALDRSEAPAADAPPAAPGRLTIAELRILDQDALAALLALFDTP